MTPPAVPGGEWHFRSEISTSVRDRYDWHAGPIFTGDRVTVTDATMGRFNEVDHAANYNMEAQSSRRVYQGEVSPRQ
jgi:hypothetical protein